MTIEEEAAAEVAAIRARIALLERMIADPEADPAALRRQEIIDAATAHRFRNPELAARLLAADEGDAQTLVKELGKQYPYMRVPTMNELLRAGRRREAPGE